MRPWDTLDRRREAALLAGWPRCTPASPSTPTPRSGASSTTSRSRASSTTRSILYCADNGASGEGSPNGSVNENKFFNAWPDTIEDNLRDDRPARQVPTPTTTTRRAGRSRSRRRTGCSSATPTRAASATRSSSTGRRGSARSGEVREPVPPLHRHRPDDPRLLRRRDAGGRGRRRADAAARRVDALLVRRRRRADARRRRSTTRCSARAASGTRAGRRSPSTARCRINLGKFDEDRWQLFHTDEDRSEAHDLAEQHPEQARGAEGAVARRRRRSTTCCRSTTSASSSSAPSSTRSPVPASGQYTYYPGTSEIPEASAARHGSTCRTRSSPRWSSRRDTQGVIVAQGSRFGGYSLFVKDGEADLRLQLPRHPARAEDRRRRADVRHATSSASSSPRSAWVSTTSRIGPLKLYVDDQVVAEEEIRTIASRYSLCGEGLCIGYDGGDAVSSEYTPRFAVHRGQDRQGRLRRRRRRLRRRRGAPRRRDGAGLTATVASEACSRPGTTRRRGTAIVDFVERIAPKVPTSCRPRTASPRSTTTARCGARSRCRSSSASSCSGWRRWPRPDPSLRERQPWKAAYEQDYAWLGGVITKHYDGDDSDVKVLMGGMLQAFAGMTVDEYDARPARAFVDGRSTRRSGRRYARLRATCRWSSCCATSRRTGSRRYIASGGDRDFMRRIAGEIYGIPPERVIGSSNALRYDEDEHGGQVVYHGRARRVRRRSGEAGAHLEPDRPAPDRRRRQLERRHPDAAVRR